MTLILIVAGVTLAASFICSLLEAVLYAVTPAQIEVLRARGAPGAEALERMRSAIEEPIVAILTINTIAHTVGAAWCGALVGAEYGPGALAIFAVVFTILVLSITEIVPKSLGVRYAGTLATKVVLPLQIMVYSVLPLVWIAKRAMRLLTGGADAVSGPSEEEVIGVARLAARRGTVRGQEHRWVRNALRLDKVTAGELRTPRQVVETVADNLAVVDLVHAPGTLHYSRVPVTRGGDADEVIGLVRQRDILRAALQESGASVRDVMHPLHFVPLSLPAHELLDLFLARREHMVGVLDQYGTFEGVVTLEDVLECLLGSEIVDEDDRFVDMQELARTRHQQGLEEPAADGDAEPPP